MYTAKIHLSNIDDVKKFVSLVSSFPFEVNLCTDKYKMNAKSVMGVFSLNLSEPITVEVDECNEQQKELFAQKIKEFQQTEVES
ncbi:HPr family phosphocarrier protein [Caproicibacterium sp. BJN0003]|uniref:HPr family phosphocarrier protein n=1 Tax=Caproicibacterium sp. BJN0003 TaxID=2994078 RepID=UPI0022598502|nr:HPr family phosphocarrier protein [Caproicibacterium sp. BJN0003]UZT81281.1 HPr family phosphocarrier protein [Caproicibacterium sp. BJN0003]